MLKVKRVQVGSYLDALEAIGVVTRKGVRLGSFGFALQVIVKLHTDTAG